MTSSVADTLRSVFSGRILEPGDDGFDAFPYPLAAPALIVSPSTVDDTVAAVRHAVENGLPISVRSGGHSAGMWTTAPGGLVIDLGGLADVVVDGTRVTIGPGATWGSVAAALAPHELVVSSGDTATVGVGGLTLGGGVGWFVRKYGLAIDSLVSARVVTAAGDVVAASESENPELYWAIRGGGGNFGVVVEFTFEGRPLEGVVHGELSYATDDLAGLLRGFRDAMRGSPEELNATFFLLPPMGPDAPTGPQIHVVWAGTDVEEALAAIEPLLKLEGFVEHTVTAKPYASVLMELPAPPPGAPVPTIVANNGWAQTLSDDLLDALAGMISNRGAAMLMVRFLSGAFNRVAPEQTAFAWRDAEGLVITAAFLPPGAESGLVDGANAAWQPVAAHTEGTYGNFVGSASDQVVELMYPKATLSRLARAKATWDPRNVFSQNQNVRPA
jgi:FAD/FMN-containing dehydrogenase